MQHSIRAGLRFATALGCCAHVVAQVAAVTQVAAACYDQISPQITLSSTLPILGSTATIGLAGPRSSAHLLTLSLGLVTAGVSLAPYGSPCRLYPALGAGANELLIVPFVGSPTFPLVIPTSIGVGLDVYVQSTMIDPGIRYSAPLMTSNALRLETGYEPDLTTAQIAAFAPLARLHPAETYMPMDPLEFVQLSRFRHHRGLQSDQSKNRFTLAWVTTESHSSLYYDVPVSEIDTYGLNPDGTNRRPRDDNSGSSYNVFLQPQGSPTGVAAPNGVVPVFTHYRRSGDLHQIQYWWFFGFNDSLGTFNHQGDWEHVTVDVRNGQIAGMYFAAHEGGEYRTASQLAFSGGRPIVWIAKGSHAAYPSTGTFHLGVDQAADGGYQWNVSQRLSPLSSQPWRHYAGAWGEVGTLSTTTGPLGPWHKRNNP